MIELVVISDDLTGAADTGIQFQHIFSPIYLTGYDKLSSINLTFLPEVLSLYSETRNLDTKKASQIVTYIAREIKGLQPKWLYKKIDSCMRGNIGAEIDVLLDEFDLQASFIAPALPLQGRTTVFGIHYVKGIPLVESEIGRDSRSPVNKSRLTELVAANSRYEVGHIDFNLLSQKTEELVDRIQRIIQAGAKHIVFDATNQTHLDLIAELVINQFLDILPVGSAGLAKSLTTKMQKKLNLQPRSKIKKLSTKEGNLLFICGSASETLKSQVKEFVGHGSCSLLRIAANLLAEAAQSPEGTTKQQLGKQVAHLLDDNDVVLQIMSDVDILPASAGEQLVKGLAEIVAFALKETRAGGIFLSGGDTAAAVLHTISNGPLKLEQEIISGLVWGSIVEGPLAGLPVVTKAGAFGTATVMAELYRIWKTEKGY